jgi:hypothetical protein
MACTKIHFKEQELETDTKQSRQDGKAGKPDCFVWFQLPALDLPS